MEGPEGVDERGVGEESGEAGSLSGGEAGLFLELLEADVVGVEVGRVAEVWEVGSIVHVVYVSSGEGDVEVTDDDDGFVEGGEVAREAAVPGLDAVVEALEGLAGVWNVGRDEDEGVELEGDDPALVGDDRVGLRRLGEGPHLAEGPVDRRPHEHRHAGVALLRGRAREASRLEGAVERFQKLGLRRLDVSRIQLVLVQTQYVGLLRAHERDQRGQPVRPLRRVQRGSQSVHVHAQDPHPPPARGLAPRRRVPRDRLALLRRLLRPLLALLALPLLRRHPRH
mmetsp:Transcript_11513/g.36590  ORF Transcript_11513/g.36590 Transcript_11513/m.36590 type:complete len:282 (+) Transcript_11513:474-1319(+)